NGAGKSSLIKAMAGLVPITSGQVLLDEPAAGVNPALLEVLIARIQAINATGVTFVLIEHNIDMVSRLCNRIVVMAQGSLLFQGRPDEVAREPSVIEAYLGGTAA
ncbi:MAG: hypothetical protein H7245_21245, partial [Candidatus Saccharibacteria bacterium]|nr:hypothetical protein [Pseudorhodobacter sp.]